MFRAAALAGQALHRRLRNVAERIGLRFCSEVDRPDEASANTPAGDIKFRCGERAAAGRDRSVAGVRIYDDRGAARYAARTATCPPQGRRGVRIEHVDADEGWF